MNDDLTRDALGRIGEKLGAGGQATVYHLPNLRLPGDTRELVYKEYRTGHAPQAGIGSIVGKRTQLSPADRANLDSVTVWPLRAVTDGGRYCGVVVPRIPRQFYQRRTLPTGRRSNDLREAQNLFVDPALAARLGMPLMPLDRRFAVCRDLAYALAFLHDRDVVFGDINAKNVLFRNTANAAESTIMLVDCDAVRIKGSAAVAQQLNAPDWEPPEGGRALTQATDCYKLGLFVLRTLNPGEQASTSRDPGRAAPLLRIQRGEALLRTSLSSSPAVRPTAKKWLGYLREMASMPAKELHRLLSA